MLAMLELLKQHGDYLEIILLIIIQQLLVYKFTQKTNKVHYFNRIKIYQKYLKNKKQLLYQNSLIYVKMTKLPKNCYIRKFQNIIHIKIRNGKEENREKKLKQKKLIILTKKNLKMKSISFLNLAVNYLKEVMK